MVLTNSSRISNIMIRQIRSIIPPPFREYGQPSSTSFPDYPYFIVTYNFSPCKSKRYMNGFLPISKQDMTDRGWYYCDFLIVTGDAYVDHPSFGTAIISRVLDDAGYKVAILSQPVSAMSAISRNGPSALCGARQRQHRLDGRAPHLGEKAPLGRCVHAGRCGRQSAQTVR